MQFFQRLGEHIDEAWRAQGYDEERFPDIAAHSLREYPPSASVGAYETLEWALSTRTLPSQVILRDPFGQPAIQVYATPRFYIEVLHWLDGTTSIHQHGFNGAFHVLAGSSIHATYRFEEDRHFSVRLGLGRLAHERIELLTQGDVRPILAGRVLIHSLFHLDRPSMTVVVRTYDVPGAAPQYSYLRPSLAYDPFYEPEHLHRQQEIIEALARLEHPSLEAWLVRALREADPLTFVKLTLASARHVRGKGRWETLLGEARTTHGELADAMQGAIAEQRRLAAIVRLRGKLRSAEHRYLLALLLHFDRGRPILDLIEQRHPQEPPEAVLLRWLSEMTEVPDPEVPGKKVFDFALDGSLPDVARAMLGGRSLPAVLEILGQEFDAAELAEQVAEVTAAYEALRALPVFGPLFR